MHCHRDDHELWRDEILPVRRKMIAEFPEGGPKRFLYVLAILVNEIKASSRLKNKAPLRQALIEVCVIASLWIDKIDEGAICLTCGRQHPGECIIADRFDGNIG